MRTTVTLDKDVERMLRDAMHRSRKSFKETLNAGLRAGLTARPAPAASVPFVVKARSLGLRAGIDPAGFKQAGRRPGGGCISEKERQTRCAKREMIIPDVNLLLYTYNSDSAFHAKASEWWQKCLSGAEPVGLAPVVLFGFVRIATHPRVFSAPMTPAEAASHVRSWLSQPVARILEPLSGQVEQVLELLEKLGTAGNLVTDAQIASLATEHNAIVHTADADFLRFSGLRWFNPSPASEAADCQGSDAHRLK